MSEATTSLHAINCVTCGVSLPLLGGHKVKSVTCRYCGSLMDRHNDFALLLQYQEMPRPDGPLSLGDRGELNGVQQTVIGIVGHVSHIEGETYRWTDYQLYSPTHGYSWLTWNNGHAVHSRRIRGDLPSMEGRYRQERFDALGKTFRFFERYESQINFLEGELTWQPRLGDKAHVSEAAAAPLGLSMSESDAEVEHSLQTYIPRDDLISAFNLTNPLRPITSVHPTQPFLAPFHRFVALLAGGFALLCVAIAMLLSLWSEGEVIAKGTTHPVTGALTMTFESKRSNALTQLTANRKSGINEKSTGYFNISLANADTGTERKALLRSARRNWVNPLRIRLAEPGSYTVKAQGVPYYKGDPMPSVVAIEVRQGLNSILPVGWLALLFGAIALSYYIRKVSFSVKRWKG